jgi:hypothetical protein
MPDPGTERPRRYTAAELEWMAKAARIKAFDSDLSEALQAAVEAYQWADEADPGGLFFYSNKERRNQLTDLINLCGSQASAEEIQNKLNELDGPTSQLLGPVSASNPQRLARAADRARHTIPLSAPDRSRARRQFVRDLVSIFSDATGQGPGRRVRISGEEYGELRDFVRAALDPFKAAQGCEDDIKFALRERNEKKTSRKQNKKNAANAKT